MKLLQDILACTLLCPQGSYNKGVAEEAKIVGQTAHQISLLNFFAADSFMA